MIAGRVLWQEWRDRKRGWRIGVSDFGGRSYEEHLAGKWVSIDLPCVSDFREPPLQISIPGKKEWQNFPTWTEERHAQILDRILAVLESRERILIDADTNRTLHRDRHQER